MSFITCRPSTEHSMGTAKQKDHNFFTQDNCNAVSQVLMEPVLGRIAWHLRWRKAWRKGLGLCIKGFFLPAENVMGISPLCIRGLKSWRCGGRKNNHLQLLRDVCEFQCVDFSVKTGQSGKPKVFELPSFVVAQAGSVNQNSSSTVSETRLHRKTALCIFLSENRFNWL